MFVVNMRGGFRALSLLVGLATGVQDIMHGFLESLFRTVEIHNQLYKCMLFVSQVHVVSFTHRFFATILSLAPTKDNCEAKGREEDR